jgi:hypothetical protein
VPVTLSASSGQTVSMKYSLLNGTATGGTDFDNHGGTLSFRVPPGHSQTYMTNFITVPVFGDSHVEADENLVVRLSSLSPGYGLARYRGTVTILNDDPTGGATASFGVGDTTVRKSDSGKLTLPFFVTLSDAQSVPVTVDYTIAGVTATSGVDFSGPAAGTLTFAPGQMAKTVNITVLSHANTDGTVTITLSNPAGTSGLTLARAVGTGSLGHNA